MISKRLLPVVGLLVILLAIMPVLAASSSDWTEPVNLSDWLMSTQIGVQEIGADGTQVAIWADAPSASQGALFTRTRPFGGEWSAAENVTGWTYGALVAALDFWRVKVAPDGACWAVWLGVSGSSFQVMGTQRPPESTWQSSEGLSGQMIAPAAVGLDIGPDGHLAMMWTECGVLGAAPCKLYVRRRSPTDSAWGSSVRVDTSPAAHKINQAQLLVGPGGLTVVLWAEENPGDPTQWGVMARAYVPSTGTWEAGPSELSGGWIKPASANEWLSQSVMGGDGLVVAAWTAKESLPSTKEAVYSVTRSAADGTWNLPVPLSASYDADWLGTPRLALAGGTTVAAWSRRFSVLGAYGIYANARDANAIWGTEERVSEWRATVRLGSLEVWPGGTAVALWQATDDSRPADVDQSVFWSARSPHGSWGSGGKGQLGGWYDKINGVALEVSSDGGATAVWALTDASQPADQTDSLLAATWPPGGSWSGPVTVTGGRYAAAVWHQGTVIGPSGLPVGVLFWAARKVASPSTTPFVGFFYTELPLHKVYLPTTLRS